MNEAFFERLGTTDADIYIGGILEQRLANENDSLKEVEIFITDPMLFDEPLDSSKTLIDEKPLNRIEISLEKIPFIANKVHPSKTLKVYFTPLLQMDHLVITDEYIISRNTMLWVGKYPENQRLDEKHPFKEQFKGTWFFAKKAENPYGIYKSYSRYLHTLKENSIVIPLDVDYTEDNAIKNNSRARKILHLFRTKIKNLDKSNITINKLYQKQLMSYLRSTWVPQYRNPNNEITWQFQKDIFKPNKTILSLEDLYDYKNLLGDSTQKLLLAYIKKTEELLNQVVNKYDKEGFAKIIPSLELGVPNNVQRLAGGFATGSLILWKCGTPIIPIDATINICTSTVYECINSVEDNLTESFFEKIKSDAFEEGFISNFQNSNHFIIYAKSSITGKHFLILHSSAKEFKYSSFGLYPHKKSWYSDKIKTVTSGDRYLRYIKDDDAVQFSNIVKSIDLHNHDTHEWFAKTILGEKNINYHNSIKQHHYFMPSASSIAIGTYLVDKNEKVPIFSDNGKDISIVKSLNPWTIKIGVKDKVMIPHGWGQVFLKDINSLTPQNGIIKIGNEEFRIEEHSSFTNPNVVKVRDFVTPKEFLENGAKFFEAEVIDNLKPIISLSKHGYKKF